PRPVHFEGVRRPAGYDGDSLVPLGFFLFDDELRTQLWFVTATRRCIASLRPEAFSLSESALPAGFDPGYIDALRGVFTER
ncbi:MAG TPA: hypothetical protein VGE01_07455, partial [Fimbriimonas sp.]